MSSERRGDQVVPLITSLGLGPADGDARGPLIDQPVRGS